MQTTTRLLIAIYKKPNGMLIKIDRQEAIDKFPTLPLRHYNPKEDEDVFNYPKVFANYVLTLPSKSYKGHNKLLGTELVSLASNLGFDNFVYSKISFYHPPLRLPFNCLTVVLKCPRFSTISKTFPYSADE